MARSHKRPKGKLNAKMIKSQWKPGQSGNPSGKPKREEYMPDLLREIGSQYVMKDKQLVRDPETGEPVTKLKALLMVVFRMALNGDMAAVHFIAERTEGKIPANFTFSKGETIGIAEEIVDANSPIQAVQQAE